MDDLIYSGDITPPSESADLDELREAISLASGISGNITTTELIDLAEAFERLLKAAQDYRRYNLADDDINANLLKASGDIDAAITQAEKLSADPADVRVEEHTLKTSFVEEKGPMLQTVFAHVSVRKCYCGDTYYIHGASKDLEIWTELHREHCNGKLRLGFDLGWVNNHGGVRPEDTVTDL